MPMMIPSQFHGLLNGCCITKGVVTVHKKYLSNFHVQQTHAKFIIIIFTLVLGFEPAASGFEINV